MAPRLQPACRRSSSVPRCPAPLLTPPPPCGLHGAPCSGGKLTPEYQGDRSARHLRDWALSLLPKHVKSVNKEAQLADFLRQCQGGGPRSSARWGVCALLLSDKAETPALYKSLALR